MKEKLRQSSGTKALKERQREKAATKEKHWVRLTRVCNNNCIFCLDTDSQDGTLVPVKEIRKNFLEGRRKGISQVILSGGEATIHPNFLEIVKMARKAGYQHVQVITNGRMLSYPDFLAAAVKAGVNEITFSIHGHTEKLHDTQTRVKGSFKQAMTGLKNALRAGRLIVNIDIVVNKQNYKYLADTIEYFVNLGVHEFDLLQIIPFGRAWKNRKMLFYDISGALPHIQKALSFSRNPGIFIWTNRFPPRYLEGFEDLIQHPAKLYDEIRGRREMFEKFIREEKEMQCHGKRCQFCFLSNFCEDLIEFKKKGKITSKEIPMCFGNEFQNKQRAIFRKEGKFDVFRFLDFFINNRYFLKGAKCKKLCGKDGECDGAHVNYIRKRGFNSLAPIIRKK